MFTMLTWLARILIFYYLIYIAELAVILTVIFTYVHHVYFFILLKHSLLWAHTYASIIDFAQNIFKKVFLTFT